ncbi:uncharacterized protein LOC134254781 [Saccostrea cucullata]|uniref:uncharacterized protein LOC134254781 n=1 Tax=Saccostrea cuccullata TaxID=36930 RepID=UPI002ED0EE12
MDQVPDSAQHYIECDTESCRNLSKFYCNSCHQRICVQCKQTHVEKNNEHEIVLYQERKRKLPSEKCKIHPTQDVDVYCKVCQDPLCSTCVFKNHRDHDISDLETIYNDILQQCQMEITEIWNTVIPKAKNNIGSIGEKKDNVKREISKLRVSMKNRADELKIVIDSVLTDYNKKIDEIENSIQNVMEEQQKRTEDYINYLYKIISDYESKLFSVKPTELMKIHIDISLASLKRPNKAKLKVPIFTPPTLHKEEICKQFGKIELDSSEMFELSSIKKVSEITIKEHVYHLFPLPPDNFWASGVFGNLMQYNMERKILKKITNSMTIERKIYGDHTVTIKKALLYTDYSKNTVYRVANDMSINNLIQTGNWKPGAIYSSPINEHIFVGMERNLDNKITRYNKEGRKLQEIQWDVKRRKLYQSVNYITENINGDICTSDTKARQVVVVTASGEYRFSYSGHRSQSGFLPCGICTDVLGHILVCNGFITFKENCSSIHLLDKDGHILSFLLTPEQCPPHPRALCIDDKHNLWVGGWDSSAVYVYRYLLMTKTYFMYYFGNAKIPVSSVNLV